MKTTLYLDDELLARAQQLSGIREKTQLVNRGLQTLVSQLASQRLAQMGGALPSLKTPPRRRKNAR